MGTRFFSFSGALLFLCLLLLGLHQLPAQADDIDNEDYWKTARQQISQLGDGYLVWESRRTDNWRIWTVKLDGTGLRQLSKDEDGRQHFCPKISPDGKKLIYLSLPGGSNNDPPLQDKGDLHLMNADGTDDHVIVTGAQRYQAGWDRAVTWFNNDELAFIADDGNTYRLYLATGKRDLIITGGQCWLPNTKLTNAVFSFNTFSILDAKTQTVTLMPHLGGCQPYFTQDGDWGFWMRAPGGPIYKMRLSTREISPLFDGNILPHPRNYVYYPMVSANQRLLAFGAVDHNKIIGDYGGYVLSDYDIYLAPIDPKTLDVIGTPVRYTFTPKCDRFPDVFQEEPVLGYHADKAPFTVEFASKDLTGTYEWNYGDGTAEKTKIGKHTFTKAGVYLVEARQGARILRGQVRVAEASAPRVVGNTIENERELVIAFDQPVNAKKMTVRLGSGAKIEKWTLGEDGRSLRLTLEKKPTKDDTLFLDGVTDTAQRANKMDAAQIAIQPRLWPSNPDGLVFLWEDGNKPNTLRDPLSGQMRSYSARASDQAILDRNYAMVLDGGSFFVDGFGDQFSNAVRKSNELSMECTVTPNGQQIDRGGCVLAYGVWQAKDKLLFSLNGATTEVATLPINQTSHVVITYVQDLLMCYVDGKQVFSTDKVKGDLQGYPTGGLSTGNNLDGRTWRGTIEGIALYNRALTPEEVLANYKAFRIIRETRKPVERVELDGKLVAASRTPLLKEIQPYNSALVINEYEVVKLVSGTYVPNRIRIAHWVILDGQTQRIAQMPLGTVARIVAEPMPSQPQLEGQYVADTLDVNLDLPLYYATAVQWDNNFVPRWNGLSGVKFDDKDVLNSTTPIEGVTGLPKSYILGEGQQWITLEPDATGYINMHVLRKGNDMGCGYALALVKSPTARKALLSTGSVGGVKAWVNGKEALAGNFGRYPFLGYRQAAIELKEGWNELLVKTNQQYAFWGFSCDILSPEGRAMPDLIYAIDAQQ